MTRSSTPSRRLLGGICAIAVAIGSAGMLSADPGRSQDRDRDREDSDRAERALERAERDAARAAERAARDEARYVDDRAEILDKTTDDPVRQERELAKLEEDRAETLMKAQEEAIKDAEDLAEELAKAQEEAAEDAAERAEEAAEYGSSSELSDIAEGENPEYDERGFPVRRGEIVGLSLSDEQLASLGQAGFEVVRRHELQALGNWLHRLKVPEGMDAPTALAAARDAEPNATFDFTHYYAMQYVPSGNDRSLGAATLPRKKGRLTIGMIDTAIVSHPALSNVSITQRDFADAEGVPKAHGTAVASILASEGSSTLYVANIFRGRGKRPFTSADTIVDALDWMVAKRVPVVNMSLSGPRNAILDRLIEQAIGRGTLIVAAAGNGGPSAPPAYPAALPPVIAVTAVDQRNRVYRYANQGRYITVSARGVNEPAANALGGITRFSGTSYATPHVAAWMARCRTKSSPTSCARRLRRSAQDLGAKGYDPVYGYGLIL
ncbi:S8 family serine peptidase [Erythrobacter sp. THAF29]|uniref:S8 family serine peptidase n=1 Tax=Erythrobacter sp. THAF29 TaxID=2587851 RepID=UPI001F330AFB|nr:S8 family serine peptidase [Erythrobacter sp. THAF29]